MKKIVILRCLHAEDVCTGAACLKAFSRRTGSFSRYPADEELDLEAFMACSGCEEVDFHNAEGLTEKIEKIRELTPDAIHIGMCATKKDEEGNRYICPIMADILQRITEKLSVEVVQGTH